MSKRAVIDAADKSFREWEKDWEKLERIETVEGIESLARYVFRVAYWIGWEAARNRP